MPWAKDAPPAAAAGRAQRIIERTRHQDWKKLPRRIEASECITCDLCVRSCPPEFGAIVDRGLDVIIIPELCSGCPVCVMVCPVDCIYVDEQWTGTDPEIWNQIEPSIEGAS